MAAILDPSNQQQQTWVPFDSPKDCSHGFCSIYCPQWCSILFPPPPPFSFVDPDDSDSSSSSATAFSPLVIAIIGILASAFLLVSYYTIISKYCGGFRRRHRRRNRTDTVAPDDSLPDEEAGDQSHRHEAWHVPTSNGLDEALIGKISVYKYRRGEGVVDGSDCSVCLSEFREDESLRLLPKCAHAFHIQCIDTWLRSHSNCPLCRANIISVNPLPPPQLPPPPPPAVAEERNNDSVVIVSEDLEEEINSESSNVGSLMKEASSDVTEIDEDDECERPQAFRRSFSINCSKMGRVSIADILRESTEDEFVHTGSSSRGEGGKLHCAMNVVAMKRSMSSERFTSLAGHR